MDDDEYIASTEGKDALRQALDLISPRNGTPAVIVEASYEKLPATTRRLLLRYLDKKVRMGQRLNKKENNVAKALGLK